MKLNKPYTRKEYADLVVYCNKNNCHIEDKGKYLESVPNIHAQPDYEAIKEMRKNYRRNHIDDATAERSRKMANGSWSNEDEINYLSLDAEVNAWIEKNLPYPQQGE